MPRPSPSHCPILQPLPPNTLTKQHFQQHISPLSLLAVIQRKSSEYLLLSPEIKIKYKHSTHPLVHDSKISALNHSYPTANTSQQPTQLLDLHSYLSAYSYHVLVLCWGIVGKIPLLGNSSNLFQSLT